MLNWVAVVRIYAAVIEHTILIGPDVSKQTFCPIPCSVEGITVK